jgi:hypothetical protein
MMLAGRPGRGPTLISLAILAILPLIFLWRVVFLGHVLISLDMLLTYEPWRSELPGARAVPLWNELAADTVRNYYPVALYITESWRQGELPAWYPYAGNSLPLLGAGFFQVLYPINVLLWLSMPVHIAFGWSAILHLFLGSLFTYLFLAELGAGHFGRLLSAIAFTYCGSLVIWLSVPSVIDSMVWLPLLFWGFEAALTRRDWRWSLAGATGGGLMVLGGHMQLALYGFTGLACYGLGRAVLAGWSGPRWRAGLLPAGLVALILTLSGGLAAAQLLPAFELLPQITRSDIEFDPVAPPQNLLRTLIPDLLGTHRDGEVMTGFRQEAYLYFGLLPLFLAGLALFSPRRHLAALLVGVGALFLLVIYNVPPFFQLFAAWYPAFDTLGFQRTMFVITFLWASAAGLGADWLVTARPQPALRTLLIAGLLVGGLVIAYGLGLGFIAKYQGRPYWGLPALPDIKPNLIYHLTTLFFFLFLLALNLLLLEGWRRQRLSSRRFANLALVVLVLDLFWVHLDQTPALPAAMLYPTTPSLQALQRQLGQEQQPLRVSGAGRVLWPGTAGAVQVPSIAAYTSFPLKRYDQYADATGLRAASNFRVVSYRPETNRLLDALNVKYLYATRTELAGNGWVSLLRDGPKPEVTSTEMGAGQIKFWNINNWTQPVLEAPAPTALRFLGPLPAQVTLETAVAIHPEDWSGDGVRFEIYSGTPAEPEQTLLFSQMVTPREAPEQRDWLPLSVTIAGQTDQPTLVSLVSQPQGAGPVRAGWADPLIRSGADLQLLHYGPNSIYLNTTYLPRMWAVQRVSEVPLNDPAAVLARLTAPDFAPAVEAVVEGRLPQPLSGGTAENKAVLIQRYGPGEVVATTQFAEPGLVVLADVYYPGWRVYVDEVEQPLYPTNLAMRGVFVTSGTHTVRFVYDPISFKIGGVVTVATLGLMALALGADRFYQRRYRGSE